VLIAVADQAGLAVQQAHRAIAGGDALEGQSAELRLAAVMLLAETLDLRDAGTARHSRTVGEYARHTADELGLSPDRVERIHAAGVLHDLGKLGIADAILQKPGALDEAEWKEIVRHPEIGARILEHAGMRDIAGWVRAHHERIDGRGYPKGIGGEEIPLEARILAVADAYEAMIADRPYRAGIPAAAACAEIIRCAGTQFDRAVVDAFLTSLERSDDALTASRWRGRRRTHAAEQNAGSAGSFRGGERMLPDGAAAGLRGKRVRAKQPATLTPSSIARHAASR
jgi:HD-GYP domain-containing protein (c-di-GMP phosphodiesterase class II)